MFQPDTEITCLYTCSTCIRGQAGRRETWEAQQDAHAAVHAQAPKYGRLGNNAGHLQWSPSCAARVRAAGDLRGQPVLHNNAALPKAFTWCHSSEFSKAKEAGEEERLEGEGEPKSKQREWKERCSLKVNLWWYPIFKVSFTLVACFYKRGDAFCLP